MLGGITGNEKKVLANSTKSRRKTRAKKQGKSSHRNKDRSSTKSLPGDHKRKTMYCGRGWRGKKNVNWE